MDRYVLIFSSFPRPEEEKDGYFQRVLEIDRLLSSFKRLYVTFDESECPSTLLPRANPVSTNIWKICIHPKRPLHILTLFWLVLKNRKIYVHSVFNLARAASRLSLKLPFVRSVLDMHGVVPEELAYNGNVVLSTRLQACEKFGLRNVKRVIVVTNAMKEHFQNKYDSTNLPQMIDFPIIGSFNNSLVRLKKLYDRNHPIVIYAGGVQRWQQIELMLSVVEKDQSSAEFRFFVPDPLSIHQIVTKKGLNLNNRFHIATASKQELVPHYERAHFGFILREQILVNRVACPTKLVEYLQFGIIPIMNNLELGDFKSLGLRYLSLSDFERGALPDSEAFLKMQNENRKVLEKINIQCASGVLAIKDFISGN